MSADRSESYKKNWQEVMIETIANRGARPLKASVPRLCAHSTAQHSTQAKATETSQQARTEKKKGVRALRVFVASPSDI